MTFRIFLDGHRHIVTYPYMRENLDAAAERLGIGSWWFHQNASHAHYDAPARRMRDLRMRPDVEVVSGRTILAICKGWDPSGVVDYKNLHRAASDYIHARVRAIQ